MSKSNIRYFFIVLLGLIVFGLKPVTAFADETLATKSDGVYKVTYTQVYSDIEKKYVTKESYSKKWDFKSKEYESFLNSLKESIQVDFKEGLASFKIYGGTETMADHVVLKKWGKFLYDYAGKGISEMPNGNISLEKYTFIPTRDTKTWLKDNLIPTMYDSVLSISDNYNCDVYTPVLATPLKLNEVTKEALVDSSLVYSVNPFLGVKKDKTTEGEKEQEKKEGEDTTNQTLAVHSVGENYGVQLEAKFVSLLSALNKENGLFMRVIDKQVTTKISIVGSFAYLGTPKKVEMQDTIYDFNIDSAIGVNLLTGNIISLNSLESYDYQHIGTFEEHKLDMSNFTVVGRKDGMVVVPTTYTEYFTFNKKDIPTGVTLNINDFLSGGKDGLLSNENTIDMSMYVPEGGTMKIVETTPFNYNIFATSDKMPYARVLTYIMSEESETYISKEEKTRMIELIKKAYEDAGKGKDFEDLYVSLGGVSEKAETALGFGKIIVIIGVLGGVIFAIVFLAKRKKSKDIAKFESASNKTFGSSSKPSKSKNKVTNQEEDNSLLFSFDEDEED